MQVRGEVDAVWRSRARSDERLMQWCKSEVGSLKSAGPRGTPRSHRAVASKAKEGENICCARRGR